jgi:Protein of unknown function (DUF3179)
MRVVVFVLGLLLLMGIEIARVYYIMPFPGSQEADTINLAYTIQANLGWIRLIGFLLIAYPLYLFLAQGTKWTKLIIGGCLALYLFIFYTINFQMMADKMFYQPSNKILSPVSQNRVPRKQLVIGVSLNGESKAYPIEIIGYHHQVRDEVGGQQVMITYCTVCRTGRVYSPTVDGKPEIFRLVGMDHFNAMFEDKTTRSWWRQVNGEAIAGELKGKMLTEVPSEQMGLDAWIKLHPGTLIMQPDSLYKEEYDGLKNYDEGTGKGKLTGSDSLSWQKKSWVVGVPMGMYAKAYDWNDLKKMHVINDEVAGKPIIMALEVDSVSFHTWSRIVGQDTLQFLFNDNARNLMDKATHSVWDWSGKCIEGNFAGKQLTTVQSYQEFWHSWRTFHPQTTQYKADEQSK